MTTDELVVLVDTAGNPVGTAPKSTVHGPDTPLHMAFSSYVFDGEGRVLLSRRAAHKITWPDVWTNSCCGHPLPDEPLSDAVRRRLWHELGLTVERLDLVLPRFSYRAVMDNGVVEHELCPVYRSVISTEARPNPDEVGDVRWVPWPEFVDGVTRGSLSISPWCREQVPLLAELGDDPLTWSPADPADLPPAAQG